MTKATDKPDPGPLSWEQILKRQSALVVSHRLPTDQFATELACLYAMQDAALKAARAAS